MKSLYVFLVVFLSFGCSIKYSFTGISISPEVKTFTVKYFPNMATLVVPTLSNDVTEGLKRKLLTTTKLKESEEGDLMFEGEIRDYTITPQAIQADEIAAQNRVTITIRVKFTNEKDPAQNYDKSFSQYADYNSSLDLQSVQASLNEEILKMILDDIFNAALGNW